MLAYSSSSSDDAGIPCRVLMSFAAAVSMIKEALVCILGYAGISISKWEYDDSVDGASSSPETPISPSEFYVCAFKKANRPARHDSGRKNGEECLVCLERLFDEEDGWVYKLVCGHVFHVVCMETWLKLCNLSCPLCRANVLPLLEEEQCIYPM